MAESFNSSSLRDNLYQGMNIPQQLRRGNKPMFKNTLTPKIAKKIGASRTERLPPVVFENGSIIMSFTKDMSAIPRKGLDGGHASSMMDSTFLRGLNKSGNLHPHYKSAVFSNASIIEEEPEQKKSAAEKKHDYLTPLDFIELVRTDPEMRDEFCYMLKRGDAYDWEIVDFAQKEKEMHKVSKKSIKINQKEYMTISSRGIVHTIDGDENFITLDEWEREYKIFNKLKHIKFFNHYKLWKNFMLWRKLRRRTNFKKKRNYLEKNLFLIDEKLSQPLLDIKGTCIEITLRANLIDLKSNQPKLVTQFEQGINSDQLRETEWLNQRINGEIKKRLSDSCRASLNRFKELNKIKNREGDDTKAGEDKPMALANEMGKEMPYTQEATIRVHYKKLKKFIRLVDYLVLESKMGMMNNSLLSVNKFLENAKTTVANKVRNNGGLVPILIIKPSFEGNVLGYVPDKARITKVFRESITRGLHYISDQHSMLVNAPEFALYSKTGDNQKELGPEHMDLHDLVTQDEIFNTVSESISVLLNELFSFVELQSDDLVDILKIVIKCKSFTRKALENREREEINDMIEDLVYDDDNIKRMVDRLEVGIFSFEREDLKKQILEIAMQALALIEDTLPDIMMERAHAFSKSMQTIYAKLSKPVNDVESFIEHIKILKESKEENDNLTGEFSILQDLNLVFNNEMHKIRCPEDCRSALTHMKANRDLVKKTIDDLDLAFDHETNRFKKELTNQIPKLEKQRRNIEQELEKLDPNNSMRSSALMVEALEPLKQRAQELLVNAEKFVNFQEKLDLEPSNIEDVGESKKRVLSYHSFWTMKNEWEEIINEYQRIPVKTINVENMRLKIDFNFKKVNALMKEIENVEAFKVFKDEMEKYKGLVEVLEAMAVKALGPSEWQEIKDLVKPSKPDSIRSGEIDFYGFDFEYDSEEFKLPQVMALDMIKYKNEIYEIAMRAAKEKDLKERLDRIKEWINQAQITTNNYKNEKDVYILGNNEKFIKELDANLVDVTNILSNKYVVRIKDKILKEQKKLVYFQQFFDELCYCQRVWMYLEPIYNGDENNKELAKEKTLFNRNVQKPFTKIMKDINDNFRTILSKIKATDYSQMSNLEKIHNELEVLEKKLISYLERKRKTFPRFYFISNDDLIEILSQAKDFEKVQGHLNKLFDAIKKISIEPTGLIIAMESPEGEIVPFSEPWTYNGSESITDQLKNIENGMYATISQSIKSAIKGIKEHSDHRIEWMMGKHCAQAILTADSMVWSNSTENSLEADDPDDELDHLIDMLEKDLKDVIEKVRTLLSKNKRRMINSLITQDVHYRDITEMLYTENVGSKEDFKWQQQLRFYQLHSGKQDIVGRQVNTELVYGNEYLGVPSKLAITPLTDRCWMTITCALYLHLGCAPVGPAGTGKTESTKDLAKNLGTYCVVYNCSEQVTVSMMSTQFMGVMMTGAWLCLDEFNRIDIDVLSVIAQQVLSMKHALTMQSKDKEGADGNAAFFFDGQPVPFGEVSKFSNLTLFTTMNPGYAGRTELPDNLKVLFRSVSMMVPDYALIAEILLYSEGFFNAKDLAIKLTKLYKLASEQLSQQQHYDFGMRAVKSILSMAGTLKRNNPHEDEDLLLIEAMKDTNTPKFIEDDIKLFEAIVQDLFPKKLHHKVLNASFVQELHKSVAEYHLQPVPKFIDKCCQFDEIMKIRFGSMLLGPPMTGKTSVLNCLRLTYRRLFENSSSKDYLPIDAMVLNPKSITMGELYGMTDSKTGDFSNGLASKIFADFASREKKETKWIVFDGPVDSLWIENMNSVLDDSMTLCLSNGKRIKLKLDMRVLFEVQDLAQASPATVSRIGMVYLDSDTLYHIDMLKTIFEVEFKDVKIPESHKDNYISRADMFFDKLLIYLRKNGKEPLRTINNNLVSSFCRIIKTFYQLGDFKSRFVADDEEEDRKIEQAMIGKVFIFASAWSLMSTIDENTTVKMDQLASNLFNINELPRGSLFDCYLDLNEKEHHWIKWDSMVHEFEYDPGMKWSDILVPTINTKRFSYLLRRAIMTKYPIYFVGITGTGKTVICQNVIKEMNDKGLITPLQFTFSAKTSSHQIQAQITSKMNLLRREKNTPFGIEKVSCLVPKYTPKSLVVHIDDINMPEVEMFGAQPPIELLRQIIDQHGFYDRQLLEWREVEDTVFIATSVPPGNGRMPLTDRFMRHFHILNIQACSEEIMKSIFGKIVKNFFEILEFKPKIKAMDENLVTGTLLLYREMVNKMLPTPKKFHYIFNLRDVSKVFQGIVKMRPQKFVEPDMVAKLWIHECTRVFSDRLVTKKDREFFATTLSSLTGSYAGLSCSPQEIIDDKYLFGDFLNMATRELEYLDKMDKIIKSLDSYMVNTKVRIELFTDSIKHLCRINRILRQVGGHGLLIGVGGSGKKSLVTVAAEMAQTNLKQIEPTKDYDIKAFRKEVFLNMLTPAGIEGKEVTFLLTDTHIVRESFLEEVNNLINTGEIILEREEMEKLRKGAETEMAKLNISEDPVEFFVKRVKEKLHILLAMSPIGDSLRTRVRNFPSFVNCCTIDWLDPWPVEALMTVSHKMLEEVFKMQNIDQETAKKICHICVETHIATIEAADDFLLFLKRKVYITPKTYIDLLKAFNITLVELKGSIEENINKLSNGLSKLIESGEKVEYYKEEIARMQPVLSRKNIEVQELISKLTVEKEIVDKQAVEVEKEKTQVQAKADQINEIKKEAEAEYQKAIPILQQALKALDVLSRGELAELKMGKLQGPKKDILECMQIFLGEHTDEKSVQKSLTSPNLIDLLKKIQPRDLTKEMSKQVNTKLTTANITEKGLQQVNAALVSIYKWLRGLIQAQESDEIVRKMEAKAEEISKVYNNQLEALKKKQEELDGVLKKLQELQDAYDSSNREKTNLDTQLEKINLMLENSGKLTVGLADEHVRWVATVKELEKSKSFILGDAFLSAASLAYHGPFTGKYRQRLIESWFKVLQENDIKFSAKYAFEEIMGDISLIRRWNLQGLPSNKISVCNGVLVHRASSFPYLIDPQLQANKWIKNMETFPHDHQDHERSLKVVKANDSKNLSRTLEACLMNNIPILIEDADEAINPYLDPLLLKQTYEHRGGKLFIKLGAGDETIVESDFRLYFTTKIANPNFLPELFIRVSIINFTVTEDGLEEQLLAEVVRVVMKEIEDKRIELVVSIAEGKNKLRQNEDDILKSLKNSQGNILENTPLVQNLENSKKQSEEIKVVLEENEIAQVKINAAREQFRPVAIRGGLLYFTICDLSEIDPMYQFSLSYVTRLFVNTVVSCKKQKDKPDNPKDLAALFVEKITENIYLNVCRGLFNDHKKIFAFLLASKIQKHKNKIKGNEWDLFLKGVPLGASFKTYKIPPAVQIDEKLWERFFYLTSISNPVRDLLELMLKDTSLMTGIEQWSKGEEPLKAHLPKDFDHKISLFQKLLMLQCLKPYAVVRAMIDYVELVLGKIFIANEAPKFSEVFNDCDLQTPMIFVLSSGSDPLQGLQRYADEVGKKLLAISLGQNQEPIARRSIREAKNLGYWVLLQNCHLSKSFMPELELIIEKLAECRILNPAENEEDRLEPKQSGVIEYIDDGIVKDFRLILTSMPCDYFPITTLQNGVKLTNEPPKGIKANMLKALNDLPEDFFQFDNSKDLPKDQETLKKDNLKNLTFSLCLLHAAILERRKFGPLGYNILYDFNDSDLDTTLKTLKIMIGKYPEVPFVALKYLTAEINYGGRVTDPWDRRVVNTLLDSFFNEDSLIPDTRYTISPIYVVPEATTVPDLIQMVKGYPEADPPSIFGMNANAEISYQIKESKKALAIVLSLQVVEYTVKKEGEKTPDDIVVDFALKLQSEDFPNLILKEGQTKPEITNFEDPLDVCLVQEVERFNKLLTFISSYVVDLEKAVKGELIMTEELEQSYYAILNNQVPKSWTKLAYPSLRSLAGWYSDLLLRVEFFRKWYLEDKPNSFWLSAFYFPQGFLTSVLQHYSRSTRIAIDKLTFNFEFKNMDVSSVTSRPEKGCIIHGLFMEACRMDPQKNVLMDNPLGQMSAPAPLIYFNPTDSFEAKPTEYAMPLYKTSKRAGTLSATGHSTNFILTVYVPTPPKLAPEYWTLNSAAFVCDIDE